MNKLFHIFRVDEKEAEQITSQPDEPHNHDFEELLIGLEGKLTHFIDFNDSTTYAPFVSFVAKGKIHRAIPQTHNGKCDIWGIRFRSEFIPETTFQLYSLYHDRANLKLDRNYCFDRMITICQMMHDEASQENPSYSIIKQLLGVLFTMIELERKKMNSPDQGLRKTQNISFGNFLAILEENFRRPVGVDFYAEKLFMSSRNLNLICQSIVERSVSEIIETRKLIEAKNLLVSTDKTISEIAFELGYKENSYFSNVFKKKSGQSPTEFRDDMKTLLTS